MTLHRFAEGMRIICGRKGPSTINEIRKPAAPERNCSLGDRILETDIERRAIPAGTVEYDDGNPATIAAGMRGFD